MRSDFCSRDVSERHKQIRVGAEYYGSQNVGGVGDLLLVYEKREAEITQIIKLFIQDKEPKEITKKPGIHLKERPDILQASGLIEQSPISQSI